MSIEPSRIAVIGAGPAGCVFAARMAQLGHDVTLIERVAFPRQRLGESLSAGVLPLLEMIGARTAVEAAGFSHVHAVSTAWVDGEPERRDPEGRGLLVDRGRFDALLMDRARALGVRVLQPGSVEECRYRDGQWQLRIACGGRRVDLAADFLADAAGRSGFLRGRRVRHQVATVALYAYWRGAALPRQPRIEAGTDAWYWAVPLPDGACNTLVFLDGATLHAHRGQSLTATLLDYLGRSQLFDDVERASPSRPAAVGRDPRSGPVAGDPRRGPVAGDPRRETARAIDATPYVDELSVTSASIKIGDSALAVDPLSSSGVQKAIQTALSGAIVANTLLRQPEARDGAIRFYRSSLARAAAQHAGWAAAQYSRVAAQRAGAFWSARAAGAAVHEPPRLERPDAGRFSESIELSPQLALVETPCIDGDFITIKQALSHPRLDEPVAYIGGWELRPLLADVRSGMTPLAVARAWTDRVPLRSALQIAAWMLEHDLLVRPVVRGRAR